MRYKKLSRALLSGLCTIALACNYLLQPVGARTTSAPSGQLSLARQVFLNGTNAIAGQTVFSGNRVKVANQGNAILNLGRLGRIELGPDSDFVLRTTGSAIGGELNSGCLTISAPASVNIEINTAKGVITSDGKYPSSLLVGFKNGAANILPTLGMLKVTTSAKSEKAAVGELITLTSDPKTGDRLLRRPATDCGGSSSLCNCSASAPRSPAAPSTAKSAGGGGSVLLPVLLVAAAGGTAAVIAGLMNGGSNGLTCVGFSCRPASPTAP